MRTSLSFAAVAVALLFVAHAQVVEITPGTFDEATASGPVLLELHASWCRHCKTFASHYESVAETLADKVTVARADGSDHPVLAQRFSLSGFPSFYLVADGKAYEYKGSRNVDGLVQFAESGGLIGGREMGSGLSGPMGPFWLAVGKACVAWEEGIAKFEEYNLSLPGIIAIGVGLGILAVSFLVGVIYLITKPAAPVERPKQN